MAEENEIGALAARAIGLAEAATRTQDQIITQQGRSRRTIRVLAVSLAADILLSVATVTLAINQQNVSNAIHQSQLNSCTIGNQFRVSQVQLWDHLIAVSPPPAHETAAARRARLAEVADIRVYVARHFRPVNCVRLYGN